MSRSKFWQTTLHEKLTQRLVRFMSTVQLAVKKVKSLSDTQAEALLDWLAQQETARRAPAPKRAASRRKSRRRQTMRDLMAWYDTIRGTTDWEPPRMPNDLVQRVTL